MYIVSMEAIHMKTENIEISHTAARSAISMTDMIKRPYMRPLEFRIMSNYINQQEQLEKEVLISYVAEDLLKALLANRRFIPTGGFPWESCWCDAYKDPQSLPHDKACLEARAVVSKAIEA